jgi:hypothetical protein
MQTESGNVFHCKTPGDASPAQRTFAVIALGVILGGVGWYGIDGTLSPTHIACWVVPSVIAVVVLVWIFERNPLLTIGIDDTGLTITRVSGTRIFTWSEIEAARFQDYPIADSGGQSITCFLIRAGGKNIELTPEFSDDATREAFEEAILGELEYRDIPETSPGLPSFERRLSLAGAWTFVASILGLLIAHAMGYHTFGTIFGLAFLFTGSVIAWMTRGQRLSQLILAATLLLIVGGSAILWVCDINVRQVLQKWEQLEKR